MSKTRKDKEIEKLRNELKIYHEAFAGCVGHIKVLKRQREGLLAREASALHTLEMCKDELDLLNHILSINKIQLTPDVVQDAQNHLRELTKEMIEKEIKEMGE